MKKKLNIIFKKGLFILFASMIIMLVSCSTNKNEPDNLKPTIIDDVHDSEIISIHDIKADKTDKKIVAEGKDSAYIILLPNELDQDIIRAANEIRNTFTEVSGSVINIIQDLDYNETQYPKVISLGQTSAVQNINMSLDINEIGSNGYVIKTIDDNVYILGGSNKGTLNGAYEFLKHTVDFRVYAVDEVTFIKSPDIYLYDFDVKDVPDFQYRLTNSAMINVAPYAERMKMNYEASLFINPVPNFWHNSFEYISPIEYKDRPEFFSNDGTQLCYTAHGDAAARDEMAQIMADKIVSASREKNADYVTITHQDANTWCDCEESVAERIKYGTDAAVVIKFINLVSDKVKEAFEASEDLKDREMNILFFAYYKTQNAPVTKNAAGEYEAIDGIHTNDNVFVFYAPIGADYTKSFYHPDNNIYAETMKAWKVVSDKIFLWTYQTNFNHYLYPYNSAHTLQDRYRYMRDSKAEYVFDQSQFNQDSATAFHHYKSWLTAKLLWNVESDVHALTNEYFEGYFYDAAEPMLEYYTHLTTHLQYLEDVEGADASIYFGINKAQYFKFGLLNNFSTYIDRAYESIEIYRETNMELYTKLYNRINLESIFIRFAQLSLYPGRYGDNELIALRQAFKADCEALGIVRLSELVFMTELYETWGIY